MFKTAATKIAHNSTIPALGGNRDLRPLQDLITAEKAVLISLQKLSVDYSKASEALRTWGLSEGDDLGDILSASTTVLNHFSSALSQYAAHGHAVRDQLKAIRTREESLGDLKRRRRTVLKKADDADKKLSKMSPEHKNLQMQADILARLQSEIRTMDSDIMTEEAALGDFKRTATRMWMGLKFGGLLECSEKGTIAGEYGKLIISEISEEISQPGLPRSLYYGQGKTESLVAEAHRCINEVALSTIPSVGFRDRRAYEGRDQEGGYLGSSVPWSPNDNKPMPPPPIGRESSDYPPPRPFSNDLPGSPATSTGGSFANHTWTPNPPPPQIPQDPPPSFTQGMPQQTVDDFGVNTRSGGYTEDSNASGGRFSTFPVKTRPAGSAGGYSLQDPPSLNSRQETLGLSFADSIAAALDDPSVSAGVHGPAHPAESSPTSINGSSLPRPPPGAAPPDSNPWSNAGLREPGGHPRDVSTLSENDDALLAYMTAADEDSPNEDDAPSPTQSKAFVGPKGAAPPILEEDDEFDKHVRFGRVEDVDEEMEKRVSLEKEKDAQRIPEHGDSVVISPAGSLRSPIGRNGASPAIDPTKPKYSRVPPPSVSPEDEEKALNGAAAREITREMEAMKLSPMPSPGGPPGRRPLSQSTYDEYETPQPSPLAPPSAPFAQRSVSPHPYAELNSAGPAPGPYGSSYSPAQPFGQSHQNPSPYGSPTASPAQAYAQSYQSSSSDLHTPTITRPPRFQSLNQSQENQIPPRFQANSSGSPQASQHIPPRFQTGGASQIPPSINLPEHQDPRMLPTKPIGNETPYRTPPEYPRSLGVSSSFTKSNTSLNSAGPTTPLTGAKTISAAAFKRPRNASTDILPDPFAKKGLPGSPYPLRDPSGLGVGAGSPPIPSAGGNFGSPVRHSVATSEDEYDYINAYVNNSGPSSPAREEFSSVADGNRIGAVAGGAVAGGGKGGGGYGDGRFATELDDSGLR